MIDHNKYGLKVGDTVILDKEHTNSQEVIIQSFTPDKMFASVYDSKNVNENEVWINEVMTYRLTPAPKQ